MAHTYDDRKNITFAQAEGAAPLPSQLEPKELSRELRALLFDVIYTSLSTYSNGIGQLADPWYGIAYRLHVRYLYQPSNSFRKDTVHTSSLMKRICFEGDYIQVFDIIQQILRDEDVPDGFAEEIDAVLEISRAAYRVFDSDTIVPVASDAEAENLRRALADLAAAEFHGARAHLRDAGSKLAGGDWSGSIRESIHAVEAVARTLERDASTLAPALKKLEGSVRVHPALSGGFSKLYGFTSDEKGIRHALLDEPVADVDETDALYMLGSCAAFVSYLINKARTSGLL